MFPRLFSTGAPSSRVRLFSTTTKRISSVRTERSMVHLTVGAESYSFHARWLAHNCSCPKCRQPSSGQRLAKSGPADGEVIAARAEDDGKNVLIQFSPDHTASFATEWLLAHDYSASKQKTQQKSLSALSRSRLEPLRISYEEATSNPAAISHWMEAVIDRGVVVVEGTPAEERSLLEFIKHTGCESSHRLYGTSFIVEATANPINVAYSSEALEPHQDLAYYESPPGIQLLHCLEFDEKIQGGLSTFVDGHAAAELLKEKDPRAFEVLRRVPASFQKDHVHRADPAKMYYHRPHIMIDEQNEVIAVFWAPPFEGPLRALPEDVEDYYRAYDAFAEIMRSPDLWRNHGVEFKLKRGDLVVFNNRRYLHGRTAFTVPVGSEGRRKLHGCYLEMDRFLNRLRVLKWQQTGVESYDLRSRPGISSFRA